MLCLTFAIFYNRIYWMSEFHPHYWSRKHYLDGFWHRSSRVWIAKSGARSTSRAPHSGASKRKLPPNFSQLRLSFSIHLFIYTSKGNVYTVHRNRAMQYGHRRSLTARTQRHPIPHGPEPRSTRHSPPYNRYFAFGLRIRMRGLISCSSDAASYTTGQADRIGGRVLLYSIMHININIKILICIDDDCHMSN